jgi:hypothetical protein|tara:strand:+ start:4608 stop:4790 length:183 start_codon:yes stop_codon:yes gene_type:complete
MFRNIFNGFRNIDFNNFYILSGVTLSFGNIYYFINYEIKDRKKNGEDITYSELYKINNFF